MENHVQSLQHYLEGQMAAGKLKPACNAPELARDIFLIYEGTANMFKITGDLAYIRRAHKLYQIIAAPFI